MRGGVVSTSRRCAATWNGPSRSTGSTTSRTSKSCSPSTGETKTVASPRSPAEVWVAFQSDRVFPSSGDRARRSVVGAWRADLLLSLRSGTRVAERSRRSLPRHRAAVRLRHAARPGLARRLRLAARCRAGVRGDAGRMDPLRARGKACSGGRVLARLPRGVGSGPCVRGATSRWRRRSRLRSRGSSQGSARRAQLFASDGVHSRSTRLRIFPVGFRGSSSDLDQLSRHLVAGQVLLHVLLQSRFVETSSPGS